MNTFIHMYINIESIRRGNGKMSTMDPLCVVWHHTHSYTDKFYSSHEFERQRQRNQSSGKRLDVFWRKITGSFHMSTVHWMIKKTFRSNPLEIWSRIQSRESITKDRSAIDHQGTQTTAQIFLRMNFPGGTLFFQIKNQTDPNCLKHEGSQQNNNQHKNRRIGFSLFAQSLKTSWLFSYKKAISRASFGRAISIILLL